MLVDARRSVRDGDSTRGSCERCRLLTEIESLRLRLGGHEPLLEQILVCTVSKRANRELSWSEEISMTRKHQ